MKNILTLIILLSILLVGYSQNQLNLLDGRQIKLESYVFHTQEGYMNYSLLKKNNKIKNTYSELDNVFSISINGQDSIIYMQLLEEEFTVDEMSSIVIGRQNALQEYKPWWAFASGVAVGCTLLLPMEGMSMWVFPIFYTAGMAFVRPSEKYVIKRHEYAINDDLYLYGYRSTGRKKIFKNTTLGVLSGIFVSGAILTTLHLAAAQ